ncbi:MAG: hypothetical protein ABFD96_01795, partial [Armatimonadia bacterium]
MYPIFLGDFTTSALTDWTVEQHVPDGYSDFVIRDQKLVFLDAGNRLLPNVPELESFVIRGALEADWGINNKEFSFQIFCAYDPHRRQGLLLEFGANGRGTYARLASPNGETVAERAIEEPVAEAGVVQFEAELGNGQLKLKLNSRECLRASLHQDCRGLIALCRGAFLGELRLLSLTVE